MQLELQFTKLCECGCGQPAPLAPGSDATRGYVKGQPMRFIVGHNTRVHPPRAAAATNRFWAKVDKRGPDDCWEWQGAKSGHGYGRLLVDRVLAFAHRFSYELHYGSIPDGLQCLHECDNPACVNPKHLFAGTHQDNMDDKKAKGRAKALRGGHSPTASFTNEQAREVRRMYATGEYGQSELGRMLGVSNDTIRQIILGKTYQDA